jgi:hypothetical protein
MFADGRIKSPTGNLELGFARVQAGVQPRRAFGSISLAGSAYSPEARHEGTQIHVNVFRDTYSI